MAVYHYFVHGLRLASELRLPELPLVQNEGEADAFLRLGACAESVEEPVDETPTWRTSPGLFELNVAEVGRFVVKGGREIWVDAKAACRPEIVRVFVQGSCFGALLHQRELLVLHAGAIRVNGGAVLFAGRSGAGKSTLVGAMVQRGYEMLSDDVSAVRVERGSTPLAHPSFPYSRLCPDVAEKLDRTLDGVPRLTGTPKFIVPVEAFCSDPLPVSHIFLLNIHNRPEITLTPLAGSRAVTGLIRSTYRRRFLNGLGLRDRQFEGVNRLIGEVIIHETHRSVDLAGIDELADKVEAIVQ